MEITRGKLEKAQKCVIYGPEGIGKSTFASKFPDPVFCDTEGSTINMDVARTQKPTSWVMLLETVKYMIAKPETCRTFVLDTADWAERMCVKHVCDKNGKDGVEDFSYGKGYTYVYEEFGKLLNMLSELVDKGVNVVVTAHAQLKKFEQPDEMGAYDRYVLKMTDKGGAAVGAMMKEWADMVLFANYKTYVINTDGQGAAKGKNKAQGGKRVMYTTHTPSWDAKNRHGLSDELDLDYSKIAHIFATDHRKIGTTQKTAQAIAPPVSTPKPSETTPTAPTPMSAQAAGAPTIPSETATEPPSVETNRNELPDGIPRALRDLMEKDGVTEHEIMYAVGQKGYFPVDTPIANLPPDFVQGVLVAAWMQVLGCIIANRENTPF